MSRKATNNRLLSPLRGWDGLSAASQLQVRPKAGRYAYHGYVHMKKIITQALLIALPYSFLVSVLFYTLTVNFFAVSPGEPSEIVYYGFDAVRHMIREYGLVNYLAGILPHYIFFGCSILIALIIQGVINGKPKNA